ncbi:hypothetical protein TNCV_4212531 [Trichonephila clavipes]|nr:hypothetical protein TNCV_4212531 [Trichonephila clavipes]
MLQKVMLDGTFSESPQMSTPSNYSSFQQMSEANCVQWAYAVIHSLISWAQQSMKARDYYAHPNIRDLWVLRCMNRCPDLVVCLKRDLQCLRPQASLVLICRPNVAGMKGRVDLAQPINRTQDLRCESTMHYHSTLFGEK